MDIQFTSIHVLDVVAMVLQNNPNLGSFYRHLGYVSTLLPKVAVS